ncbi:unnamed protein product [Lupinus luteus]|uniref:Inhibitor I9 domain-containing protein n=1 Tax=Lupinus luteus TaxID=3873 RepID=A0AAV1VV00_LUPLU
MSKIPVTPMEKMPYILTSFLILTSITLCANAQLVKKTYIIQMDKSAMPNTFSNHLDWYSSKVQSVVSNSLESEMDYEERIIYTYQTAFHGLAAKLSQEETEKLEAEDGVLAIFPDTMYELHTTRSPTFLGLENLHRSTNNIWSKKNIIMEK